MKDYVFTKKIYIYIYLPASELDMQLQYVDSLPKIAYLNANCATQVVNVFFKLSTCW